MSTSIVIVIITMIISIAGLFKDIGATANHRKVFNLSIILLLIISFFLFYFQINDVIEKDQENKENIEKIEQLVSTQEETLKIAHSIEYNSKNDFTRNQIQKIIMSIERNNSIKKDNIENNIPITKTILTDDEEASLLLSLIEDFDNTNETPKQTTESTKVLDEKITINVEQAFIDGELERLVTKKPQYHIQNRELQLDKDEIILGINKDSSEKDIFSKLGRPKALILLQDKIILSYEEIEFKFENNKLKQIEFNISSDTFRLKNGLTKLDKDLVIKEYGEPDHIDGEEMYYSFENKKVHVNASGHLFSSNLIVKY